MSLSNQLQPITSYHQIIESKEIDAKKEIFLIDLFSGFGGVSTGAKKTGKITVLACINHDKLAIESHALNHPKAVHFNEDITEFDVHILENMVNRVRAKRPNAYFILWASLECTNFSNAKGGKSRDGDSRSLATFMPSYINAINPDAFFVENVREFMAWGPLNDKGKPVSRKAGRDYVRWCNQIQDMGFNFDSKILCCADYGDPTIRKRLFLQFTKGLNANVWPSPTHQKRDRASKPGELGFGVSSLKPWKPVRECLNLENTGVSVFGRDKPLVENTIRRIIAGIIKFVDKREFNVCSYGSSKGASSIEDPSPTLTTTPKVNVVIKHQRSNLKQGAGIICQYGGKTEARARSVDEPAPTLTTQPREYPFFIKYYGGSKVNLASVLDPAASLTTKDHEYIVTAMTKRFSMSGQYSWPTRDLDKPAVTITASKHQEYVFALAQAHGVFSVHWLQEDDDHEAMKALRRECAIRGIIDVHMRAYTIKEMLKITSLPEDYKWIGSKTDAKKWIGNAVPVNTVCQLLHNHVDQLK